MLVECKHDGFLAAQRGGMGSLTGQDRLPDSLLVMVPMSPGEGDRAEFSSTLNWSPRIELFEHPWGKKNKTTTTQNQKTKRTNKQKTNKKSTKQKHD